MKDEVEMIPINRIRILNPRYRDRKRFETIIQSIKNLGLKKPIQVSLRSSNEAEGPGYDLVCGQGRIEAFMALGHIEIPALVVEVSKEERMLRSLVENMARRFPAPMDLIREIERLKAQNYSSAKIGTKLDISETMVDGLLALKRDGEDRLLEAALSGRIPLSIAIDIARTETIEAQRGLLKAYENKQLNGVSIRLVKRVIDQRRLFGKRVGGVSPNRRKTKTDAKNLVDIFKRETERRKSLLRKAQLCDVKMTFMVSALDKLFDDNTFITLLQAESLASLPKYLASKLAPKHKWITS